MNGPDKDRENTPVAISDALNAGFEVEVDVWKLDDGLYLGHDCPMQPIENWILKEENVWFHAKDFGALRLLTFTGKKNVFYHTDEDVVLTSKGHMWASPRHRIPGAICVLPELYPDDPVPEDALGICTDFPYIYGQGNKI